MHAGLDGDGDSYGYGGYGDWRLRLDSEEQNAMTGKAKANTPCLLHRLACLQGSTLEQLLGRGSCWGVAHAASMASWQHGLMAAWFDGSMAWRHHQGPRVQR